MERPEQRAELFDRLAVVGKAFASPKRLVLLDLLTQGERTVDSLSREGGMGVTTASAHLQILKLSNLVRTRRDGTRVFYRLAGDDVARLYASMREVARIQSADVGAALRAYLGEVGLDEIEQVSHEALLDGLADESVTLLDVRPVEEYVAGHIPHARSMPLGDVATVESWQPDREIVAYCRGAWCVMAHDAVRLLQSQGVRARRLEGGMLEWRTAGHPVEAGA